MNLRLTRFEQTAGAFVLAALLLGLVATVTVALKNGWFARRVTYATQLESADGVHVGTLVQMSGLRVGEVTDVDLDASDRVLVRFTVLERFARRVREGSRTQMFRPYLLSDKVLEVSVGEAGRPELPPLAVLPSGSNLDLMDVLTGRKMGALVASFDKLADSLQILGEAFADPARSRRLVRTLDRLAPTLDSLAAAATEVTRATRVANELLPGVRAAAPELGAELGQLVANMNILTTEFTKLTPAINAVAPELPRTSRRAVEAMDQAVVLLKAMQKSFFFRGGVREVLDEEKRAPASAEGGR